MLKITRGETKFASKMRCCVPFCKNTSDNVSTSEAEGKGISFHGFPSEVHLRAVWLRALGKQDSHLPDSAVVCSQHFLNHDIYETESGRQIVTGAVPSTVQVCMICLDTDSKMFLMSKHKLEEAYVKLTGRPLCDPGNLNQTVCVQCAQRLINFSRFRDKSLRARALMMDLVEKHELITRRHIKTINLTKHQLKSNMVLTTLGPDHCDLHILEHSSEDKQTELEETGHRVVVKTEGSDDSMSVDEDMGVINEEDNNVDDLVQDLLKHESVSFHCTLCLEEFIHEHEYMQHMCMHLQQDGAGDGECDTSQVCKPHTAVSSSSSHSSLITENKQPHPSPAAHAAQTSVAPLPASLATNNELQVLPTEEADTTDSCRYKNLTDCFVKLYDVFTKKVVPRQDGSLMKTKTAATEYIEQVTSSCSSSSSRGKVIVSETVKSKTDCSDKVIDIQCNDSSQNSSHAVDNSFTCDICGNMYKRKSLLIKHIKTHTAVNRFKEICQYTSNHKSHLSTHMRTHTGIKSFSCKLCDYKSAQKGNLTRHMRTHTGEKCYICNICQFKSKYKSSLNTHMRTHAATKPFSCKLCDFKSARSDNLMLHTRTHTGEKPYSCQLCEYKCIRKYDLRLHMRNHTGDKPFSCNVCGFKFALKSLLVRHMRIHTGEKPFSCKFCEYKCVNKFYLVHHERMHTGEKRYSCKLCAYECLKKYDLRMHMRNHTGDKPLSCKFCKYKCIQKYNLVRHERIHSGEKPYSCKLCEYKCSQNTQLVLHTTNHTGDKPFTCTLCEYKAARNSELVKHMRIHTGEKRLSCKFCAYKCDEKQNLIRHESTHTGEKPYSCKLCERKYARNCDLVVHMKTHTGEKPFNCMLCEYKCVWNYELVAHMRTHTGEKPFTCGICSDKFAKKNYLVRHIKRHAGEKALTCEICGFLCSNKTNLVRHAKAHASENCLTCAICAYKCLRKCNLVRHMRTHTGEKPYSCTLCEYKFAEKSRLVSHMKAHTGEKMKNENEKP